MFFFFFGCTSNASALIKVTKPFMVRLSKTRGKRKYLGDVHSDKLQVQNGYFVHSTGIN